MEESEGGGGEQRRIFVYGTLKRGFYNHKLLEDLISSGEATFIEGAHTTVETFPLVCGPHGIPYLINLPGSGNCIGGELYSVSSSGGLAILDDLEGVHRGHYERLPVTVAGDQGLVEAEAYFAHRGFGEGLWRRCGEEGLSEFSPEMGEKYVSRDDRPPDSDVVQDIHAFIAEE